MINANEGQGKMMPNFYNAYCTHLEVYREITASALCYNWWRDHYERSATSELCEKGIKGCGYISLSELIFFVSSTLLMFSVQISS